MEPQPAKDCVRKGSERIFYARNQGRSLKISCHTRVAHRSYPILSLQIHLINQTPGGLLCTGILLLIQVKFPPMVLALVVTERQNTPKITFSTAVSRPFYNV